MPDSVEDMRVALREAREKLQEQDEVLKILTEPPLTYGTVCRVIEGERRVVVATAGGTVELALPKQAKGIVPGASVRLSSKTAQIVGVAPAGASAGPLTRVRRIVDAEMLEAEFGGMPRLLFRDRNAKVEEGDLVVPDPTGSVVVHNAGKPEVKPPPREALVSWGDVGGLDQAKAALQEAIELPYKHPDLYARYGRKPTRGVLMYGPPGCGKTLLGKAAASALAKAHGKKDAQGFIYVKGPEVLSKFVGEAEANIRGLFQVARDHKQQHGYPAIIFIDEADALLGRRGSGISSDMEKTTVPAFLAEMDGIGDSSALVLLATNRQDTLDPAVVRDGRVDTKVRVSRPGREQAQEIFRLHLRERPSRKDLSEAGTNALFNGDLALYRLIVKGSDTAYDFTLGDLASGALIAGLVEKAATLAIRREIASGSRTTMTEDDMASAVKLSYQENLDLDHSEAITMAAQEKGLQVAKVVRVVPPQECA